MQRLLTVITLLAILISTVRPSHAQDLYVGGTLGQDIIRITPNGKASVFTKIEGGLPSSLVFNSRYGLCVEVNNLGTMVAEGKIQTFTSNGSRTGILHSNIEIVSALAADRQGNLYVGGLGNVRSIQAMTPTPPVPELQFVNEIKPGSIHIISHRRFALVGGLAVNDHGFVFVVDLANKALVKIAPDGKASVFTHFGKGMPSGVALDRAGNVYVCFGDANLIKKYSPSGVGIVFAKAGLDTPAGMAFDEVGNLYVANTGNNTIERFTPGGRGSVFAHDGLDQPMFLTFAPTPKTPGTAH
jgi:sugar lactone lactonase YvrE